MSVTTESGAEAHFSIANHIGHGLGVLIFAGNLLVGISPEAREGDGYNGHLDRLRRLRGHRESALSSPRGSLGRALHAESGLSPWSS
jgi:hypothetical protein